MPANRSRTLEWRRCLSQISDRGGAIEIAIAGNDASEGSDPVWRVRVLELKNDELLVDQPTALGQPIDVQSGTELAAFLAIGQNRWTFKTVCLGLAQTKGAAGAAIRLRMPDSSGAVQRCMRRKHDRLNTSQLSLPRVEVWPLLDARSTVLAERALALGLRDGSSTDGALSEPIDRDSSLMPDVGPHFIATLMNIGGGGLGLLLEPEDSNVLAHRGKFWFRLTLPGLDSPICAAGKVVHTHIESTQQTYLGIAFDFTFNPSHQRVVVDQICRYIQMQQREQLRRSA